MALVAACGLLAACGDDAASEPGATDVAETDGAATDVAATEPRATDAAPTAAEATSLAALLAAAPAPAVGAGDRAGLVYVTYGDLDAVGELIGVARPANADPDTVIDWAITLSMDGSDDGSQVAVAVLPRLVTEGGADPAEMEAELGWQVGDVAAFLEISTGPENVTLVTGDIAEADLAAAGTPDGDTWRIGDGEDFESNLDSVTPVRRLGQPLHLAWRDGIALVSRSTAAAEGFASGTSSLLDAQPGLAAVAAPLAARGVHGAILTTIVADDPFFDALGVGQAVVDGQRVALFAYHAPDAATAAELEATVRDTLATGSPATADGTWAELFPGAEVAAEGETVLAILPLAPTTSAQLPWRTVLMGDGLAPPTR